MGFKANRTDILATLHYIEKKDTGIYNVSMKSIRRYRYLFVSIPQRHKKNEGGIEGSNVEEH